MAMTAQNSKKDNITTLLQYSSVGLEIGLCVVIGITLGYFLDKYFQTSPYLTILFLFFGIAAAIKTILRLIKQVAKDDERNNGK